MRVLFRRSLLLFQAEVGIRDIGVTGVQTCALPIYPFTTDAYATLTGAGTETPVLRWFSNIMIAATLHAALVVATSALAAYALARMEFRGKKIVFGMIKIGRASCRERV